MARTSIEWADTESQPSESGGDDVTMTFRSLTFDAVTAQTRDILADLPEHPVEASVAASDHVVPKPKQVSFEAHISSAVFDESLDSAFTRRAVDLEDDNRARVVVADSPTDRVADALAALEDLVLHGTEVDIFGLPYGDLVGFQLASISMSQDTSTGDKIVPMIQARQRVTVSVSEIDAPAPSVERARNSRDRGAQPPAENTSVNAQQASETILHSLGRVVGGS